MPEPTSQDRAAIARGLISLVVTIVIMALLLFLPAGTADWPLGWWFIIAFVVCVLIAMAIVWRANPELFTARSRVQPGTQAWDYIFLALVMGGFIVIPLVAGLDHRFGWSAMPDWVVVLGYVLFVLSFAGQTWPQAVNRHFEPGVRIQEDRGQRVIDTGPYAIVRHPGYITGALLALSMPLMLASWWGLLPAVVAVAALAVRTPLEERTLREGLPGYVEYTQRVRYRWVPGVW